MGLHMEGLLELLWRSSCNLDFNENPAVMSGSLGRRYNTTIAADPVPTASDTPLLSIRIDLWDREGLVLCKPSVFMLSADAMSLLHMGKHLIYSRSTRIAMILA